MKVECVEYLRYKNIKCLDKKYSAILSHCRSIKFVVKLHIEREIQNLYILRFFVKLVTITNDIILNSGQKVSFCNNNV